MAARSVLKLFSKTCAYPLNASGKSLATTKSSARKHQQRSFSQPCRHSPERTPVEHFHSLRNTSKSLENLREDRYRDEDYTGSEEINRLNAFPTVVDMSVREPAKEFKEPPLPEETNEEGNPIYELNEGSKSDQNIFDVLYFMRNKEYTKSTRLFAHLQPSNIKPYGSNENLSFPHGRRKRIKIVYPVVNTMSSVRGSARRKINEDQRKEFSSYRPHKEYPGYEKTTKIAVFESDHRDMSRVRFSTASRKSLVLKKSKLNTKTKIIRRSSTALLKKKEEVTQNDNVKTTTSATQNMEELTMKISNIRSRNSIQNRSYNTKKAEKEIDCNDYVTVKLGDLQEECRAQKKCKPKKISFGRLPKLMPSDCPCIENVPLKEGKPIARLKKRFDIKDVEHTCLEEKICTTPRADANLKIVPKTLPTIEPKECPCVESEMTDFVIKRLPKKHIPEPPRPVCPDVKECVTPRADENLVVKAKSLPKLQPNNCPCTENIALEDVPLKRLVPKPVKEPEKICIKEIICDENIRADRNLKIEKKSLPKIKGDCPCVEPPAMKEGKPLRKLTKPVYVEKPREPCEVKCCPASRADGKIKIKKKKLPVFVPQDCPCHEKEPPSLDLKLKRLTPRSVPKEKEKICKTEEVCSPRADDGLKVKPKQLPQIEVKECPCVEVQMLDTPPLKKLKPKPVQEPKKICIAEEICVTPRADKNLKVEQKRLPSLTPGNCPCVEPLPPEDVKPLKKLKKRSVHFERVCPLAEEACTVPRADENLKVKIKKLPKLEIPECPCTEPPPQVDVKPLRRLKKKKVVEPVKVCKDEDPCEGIPRADADDWLYWKRVEVKPAECDITKGSKRSFSTISKRFYSTDMVSERDSLNLKYDLSCLLSNNLEEKIDVETSLVLAQQPLETGDSLRKLKKKSRNRTETRLPNCKSKAIDYIAFAIYKINLNSGKLVKEGLSDGSFVLNPRNRFISTCSALCEYSERNKNKQDHQTPSCECPPRIDYLQPKNPIIPEREIFVKPYPPDDEIEYSAKKGRTFFRIRKDDVGKVEMEDKRTTETLEVICGESKGDKEKKQALTWWQKLVNYFRARDCPSPEEFRRMRLKEEAERAASKAGLCLYDPKELLRKDKDSMPKVITADTAREEISK